MAPRFLQLNSEAEYKTHYETNYCSAPVITHDRIPVYFSKNKFEHAFYECSCRNGIKDTFSLIRAERMDWIKSALQDHTADRYQGWIKEKKTYDPTRQVSVVVMDFVVVVRMKLKKNGLLKADFITCYQADNSINKIRRSPRWCHTHCRNTLSKKNGR